MWGGTGPGGYDCSGLVQAAYRAAGVALPRVAQDQFDAGPAVAPATGRARVTWCSSADSASGVEHVGLYVGSDTMIEPPTPAPWCARTRSAPTWWG